MRRRVGNSDRINSNPNPRRRSNSGWETDYARRRGYSGTTVMAAGLVGFGGGIVLGSMINSNNHQYYYHSDPWSDSNGGYHQAGYYSEDGYHYSSPQEFGYCPPFGDPGYQASCGGEARNNSQGGDGNPILGLIIICCCCLCCAAIAGYVFKGGDEGNESKQNYSEQDDDDDEEMEDNGNVTTLNGEAVSRADAVGFLQAIEAEYIDGQEGSVGNLYDERKFSGEAQGRLQCEEDAVSGSNDRQDAVVSLARRWRMSNMLQNS